ncbi:hypothetical protein, partial [Cohaesibacter celericrescens]|uniref:hypothetical protein n=1 Tax=Cohaesibacter celericrescens TaxID=2067669 RepID=UPI00356AD915
RGTIEFIATIPIGTGPDYHRHRQQKALHHRNQNRSFCMANEECALKIQLSNDSALLSNNAHFSDLTHSPRKRKRLSHTMGRA